MFRPFPHEKLVQALRGKKAVGVLDRSVGFGWNRGPIYLELKSIHDQIGLNTRIVSFIDGLASIDIKTENIEFVMQRILDAAQGKNTQDVYWVTLEM